MWRVLYRLVGGTEGKGVPVARQYGNVFRCIVRQVELFGSLAKSSFTRYLPAA